ncbi:WD40/YVTN/BNR-like repeat-containing protein [Ferruginibacter sp. SUN106]|uniref:WD40/YVTN/BNR-like repeat-containing protein n=1 Tax=Ferruginibacter sp. SUN106 TaxID=2978348 RepID=UPI003D35F4D4
MNKSNVLYGLILPLLLTTTAVAQKVNPDQFKNMKARSIGPAGMSGRVTSIDALYSNPNIIYLGTASGGVWKTENSGAKWEPIFDEQPILNIGAVAVQQSNPSILWVGTGEGNPRNSINIGGGIFKSLDGGKNWKAMGLEKTKNIHRIIIDPVNPNTIYVAAIGNPYAEHPERGVYKTTDGGDTWNLILHTNDSSGCADLIIDPSNPNKLIAAMWQHRRTPYSFTSGGAGSGLYITYDAGKNWKKLGKEEGLPEGNYGRIGLTICNSEPKRIYAMVEATKNGLYKTDDGGFKWELVNSNKSDVTNRAFYFQDIRVDPKNENRLYNITQTITVSEDGGKSFRTVIPYAGIHPDHHAFWINPNDPNFIIDGNDGGIGISRDKGKNWIFSEQIPVGQFYHINTDNKIPYNVMGGMQDNGSWRGPAYTWTNSGIRNFYWNNVGGGDGFDASPDPDNNDWVYAMSQEGELQKTNVVTGEDMYLKPPTPDAKTYLRFNWNAAFAQDPIDSKTIYFGSQFLHKSSNKGLTWEIISPDLTTDNKVQQNQENNGGLSVDITGAENYNTILCIEPSAKDNKIIWIGTDDGNVQLSKDGGKTWTNFRGKIPGMPVGAWVPQIRASRYNAGEAFVVCNDYRRGDFKPYIFRTKNFGQTWERMLDENKVKGYALCMIQDPTEPNLIFAGTEQGLWISFDNGASFQQWKNGYPSVSTYDLAIQEREADLCIATFGRALYIIDDIRALRKVAANTGAAFIKTLTVFEAPASYQANYKSAPGYEWSTWGLYEGQNRNRGAAYSFFVKTPAKADSSKKIKIDSATVKIYTGANELIRTIRMKVDTGFNRNYWNYETRGIRQPGSAKPKSDLPEPVNFSMSVYPGTYKLVMTMGATSDSTMLVVNADPNVPNDKQVYDAKMLLLKRLDKSTTRLTDVTDRLTEAEETIAKIEAQFKNVEGKEVDSLIKTGKAMADSIKSIRNFIFGKPQEKQGYGSPYQLTVNEKLQTARGAVTSKNKIPDAQEFNQAEIAETLITQAVEKANTFFTTKWVAYQKLAEATPLKIFKEYRVVE